MKRPGLLAGLLIVWLCSLWVAHAPRAAAQPPSPPPFQPPSPPPVEFPAPPEQGIFVSDRGAVLSIDSTKLINKASAEVMVSTGVPVMVVTIRSVEHMGGDTAAGVEGYARELFNRWGVGNADDNRGILLLYSRGDSKVRVQLGKGWPATQDGVVQGIVDGVIVPPIKRNSAGEGLLAGVRALGAMIEADNVQRFPKRDRAMLPSAVPGAAPVAPPPATDVLSSLGVWLWIGGGVLVAVVLLGAFVLSRRGAGGGDGIGDGGGESW